jgi:hypothetical protein
MHPHRPVQRDLQKKMKKRHSERTKAERGNCETPLIGKQVQEQKCIQTLLTQTKDALVPPQPVAEAHAEGG